MRVVGYLRVSDEDQVASGLGLGAQESALRSWCERNGGQLEDPIERDEGLSGKKKAKIEKRPGLARAIGRLDRGSVLLVAKRDRFARDSIEAAFLEKLVKKRGARLISCAGEGTEGEDSPTNFFIRRIFDLMAEFESLLIGSRVRAALAQKSERHEYCGGDPPYGYRASPVECDGSCERKKKHRDDACRCPRPLEEDPEEQRVIAAIHDAHARGLGARLIARDLMTRGFVPRSGRRWHPTQVRRVLGRSA